MEVRTESAHAALGQETTPGPASGVDPVAPELAPLELVPLPLACVMPVLAPPLAPDPVAMLPEPALTPVVEVPDPEGLVPLTPPVPDPGLVPPVDVEGDPVLPCDAPLPAPFEGELLAQPKSRIMPAIPTCVVSVSLIDPRWSSKRLMKEIP
jgi:hypothetical protein